MSEDGYPFKRIGLADRARAPCVARTAIQRVKLGAMI